MPVYAECGGLMYLSRSIAYQGRSYEMVGAIPGDVKMHAKPVGSRLCSSEGRRRASVATPGFAGQRRSRRTNSITPAWKIFRQTLHFAYHVERGYGITGQRDGLILNNLLASYTHLRTIGSCYWATRFVAFIRRQIEQTSNQNPPHLVEAHSCNQRTR